MTQETEHGRRTNDREQIQLLGELLARVRNVEKRLDASDPVLQAIRDALSEQRGSRRMAAAILSLMGVIGGFVGAMIHWLLTSQAPR